MEMVGVTLMRVGIGCILIKRNGLFSLSAKKQGEEVPP